MNHRKGFAHLAAVLFVVLAVGVFAVGFSTNVTTQLAQVVKPPPPPPSIQITSPIGTTSWVRETTKPITWTIANAPVNVAVRL